MNLSTIDISRHQEDKEHMNNIAKAVTLVADALDECAELAARARDFELAANLQSFAKVKRQELQVLNPGRVSAGKDLAGSNDASLCVPAAYAAEEAASLLSRLAEKLGELKLYAEAAYYQKIEQALMANKSLALLKALVPVDLQKRREAADELLNGQELSDAKQAREVGTVERAIIWLEDFQFGDFLTSCLNDQNREKWLSAMQELYPASDFLKLYCGKVQ